MKHILFIDDIEDLVVRKDSSLLLATKMVERGISCYLLFKNDFYFTNHRSMTVGVYSFHGEREKESNYLKSFELGEKKSIELSDGDWVHMRIDPPFDSRYLRYLWMLQGLEHYGVKVVNSPAGIMNHNEKLYAYTRERSIPSYVGESYSAAEAFISTLENVEWLIFKPLDLFQGIGVEKVEKSSPDVKEIFEKKVKEYKGPIIIQPFISEVKDGEIRSIYYKGVELGTILKVPPKDGFLANIASGATYKKWELTHIQRDECQQIASELMKKDVDWIAFDILGDSVSEVNVTCPGLLVEVAEACRNGMVDKLIDLMINRNL